MKGPNMAGIYTQSGPTLLTVLMLVDLMLLLEKVQFPILLS